MLELAGDVPPGLAHRVGGDLVLDRPVSDPIRMVAVRAAESLPGAGSSLPGARTLSARPMLPCPWVVGTSTGRTAKIHWCSLGEPRRAGRYWKHPIDRTV